VTTTSFTAARTTTVSTGKARTTPASSHSSRTFAAGRPDASPVPAQGPTQAKLWIGATGRTALASEGSSASCSNPLWDAARLAVLDEADPMLRLALLGGTDSDRKLRLMHVTAAFSHAVSRTGLNRLDLPERPELATLVSYNVRKLRTLQDHCRPRRRQFRQFALM